MAMKIEREPHGPTRFHWPERLARLLGKLPDAALAKLAGVHLVTVSGERRRRGIAPAVPRRPPFEWPEEWVALLGEATDKDVAAELGINVGSVYRKRRLLGIPAYHEPNRRSDPFWTRGRLGRLGTVSDGDLARKWRVPRARVAYRRQVEGIPPFRPAARAIRWTATMTRQLGTVPDQALAGRLGIGIGAVRLARERRGIPPARPYRAKVVRSDALRPELARPNEVAARRTGVSVATITTLRRELDVPPPPRPTVWKKRVLARLGKVPDGTLARELGLKPSTVQRKRQKRGIRKRILRRWTPEEDRRLRTLSPAEAARRLARTPKAITHRRAALGCVFRRSWTAIPIEGGQQAERSDAK
jgi:hypothetical protein